MDRQNNRDDLHAAMDEAIMEVKKTPRKERRKEAKRKRKEDNSPESIDSYIWAMEHGEMMDGVVDWRGCNIDENWEKYKRKVGYYKRHPERREESEAFTRKTMEWYRRYCKYVEEHKI